MSEAASSPQRGEYFFQNMLEELRTTKRLRLEEVQALQQEITRLDEEERVALENFRRFKMYNDVFAVPELWSHINKFVFPENGTLSCMSRVNRTWQADCVKTYSTVQTLQLVIDRLFIANDWLHINELFALSPEPAMRMHMLRNTLKRAPANPDETQRANRQRFVEEAAGIELLTHTGTRFIKLQDVAIHVCKILQLFEHWVVLSDSDSDAGESNMEPDPGIFISDTNMLCVVDMLIAMLQEYTADNKMSNTVKQTMDSLLYHKIMAEHVVVSDILNAGFSGSPEAY